MSQSLYDTERRCRALWIQVVTQAQEDLEDEPVSSILYDHAVAFFVGSGQWAESRGVIADLLEMHPDDLFRSGPRWIAARRKRDGLPPEPPQALAAASTTSLPQFVALPGPDVSRVPQTPRRGGWRTVGDAQALIITADNAQFIKEKQPPTVGPRNGHRRHWTDRPGATNPFAVRSVGTGWPRNGNGG
jgi:hypothetical protein